MQPNAGTRAVILDILCLALQVTGDLFSYFPATILRIFDNEFVPVLEVMFKSTTKHNPMEY